MFVVIFRATLAQIDQDYVAMAKELRELAQHKYHCRGFESVCESGQEITVSYWDNEEHIRQWRADPRHRLAQQLGRDKWYANYRVEIAHINREYGDR